MKLGIPNLGLYRKLQDFPRSLSFYGIVYADTQNLIFLEVIFLASFTNGSIRMLDNTMIKRLFTSPPCLHCKELLVGPGVA